MSRRSIIESFEEEFHKTRSLADRAMAQLSDAELHVRINPLQNSVAAIVQHMAGNALSRWTDFLKSDGDKPDRDREAEFLDRRLSRSELLALWDGGWKCLFEALAPLGDADLLRTVTIRREPHSVCKSIVRQIAHYGWHAGQIALVAKHLKGDAWQYLTIPPGKTAEFNKKMGMK